MMRETFNVNLTLDVDFEDVNGLGSRPYTYISGYVNKEGNLVLVTTSGEIVDFTLTKFSVQVKGE